MKNTIRISLFTLFAVLFLSSCGNGYNSDDYKKNTNIKTEIKTDKIVEKSDKVAKFELVMDEVHAMKKWAMSKVNKAYTDLEYVKTVKLSDSDNIAWMWDEDYLYSKEYDITVIACNELNTPAYIFNGKTLTEVQLKMVKAEMKEMMGEDWMIMNEIDLYNYVKFDESKINNSNKLNVLFFNDDNSNSIKTLKNNLQKSKIHDWLVMYEVDYKTNSELKNKYNVTESHTFVQVDNNTNIIRRWVWSETIEEMHTALTSPTTIVKSIPKVETLVTKWTYVDYSASNLANTKWKIVLFFHANWCPTCVAAEKDILSKYIPSNLTILKANFDTEIELKKKYWIVAQTTFVQVDNKWNLIKKWVWGRLTDIIEQTK